MKPTTPPTRLHEFDMMKGVAIFLVVMGHVLAICIRGIDRAPVFKFIGEIHMPLFFFISGWFSFKILNGRVKLPSLLSRAKQLLLPMVVVSSLWVWYYPHSGLESPLPTSIEALWLDPFKGGYWFTLVLFEMILIYAAIGRFLGSGSVVKDGLIMAAAYAAVGGGVLILPERPVNILSLTWLLKYLPAFFFGVMARKYKGGFDAACRNGWVQGLSIVCTALCLYIMGWYWEVGLDATSVIFVAPVMHIALAIVCYSLFGGWARQAFATEASPLTQGIARTWSYIGRESLGIYLLHYFFLFPLGAPVRSLLEAVNLAFVPTTAVAALFAALILLCVLAVIKIFATSKPLSTLLLGK